MKKIKLGTEVMVSDPCYTEGTWCQSKISNVIPGMYDIYVEKSDEGDWGERVKSITVLHERIKTPIWDEYSTVGVDSGQMGVFCMTSYRNDTISNELPWLTEKGNPFGEHPYQPKDEGGEQWYVKMCDRTLHEDQWGVYDTGVVTSSGYGDGSYLLEVCEIDGQKCGFQITFISDWEDDDEEDFEEIEEEYEDSEYDY